MLSKRPINVGHLVVLEQDRELLLLLVIDGHTEFDWQVDEQNEHRKICNLAHEEEHLVSDLKSAVDYIIDWVALLV